MTVAEALRRATDELARTGIDTPRLDAELLLGKTLGRSRVELYVEPNRELADAEQAAYEAFVARRAAREPVAYILGEWGFRRLTLKVDGRALIPRPETEVLVERSLARIRDRAEPRVLDVGTGSGAIALAIADEHPGARVTAMDSSPDALALARENLESTGFEDRVELLEHDLRSGFGDDEYDLVVSNPPYVHEREYSALQPEIRDWEPREALVGDGATAAVAAASLPALKPGGWLVLEVGDGQAAGVARLLRERGYADVATARDLADRERVVEGRRRPRT